MTHSFQHAGYLLLQAHKQAVTYPFYFPRELWNPTHNSKPVASVLFRAIATAAGKERWGPVQEDFHWQNI